MPFGFNPFTGTLDIKPSTVSASYSGDITVFAGTQKQFDLGDEVFESAATGVYEFAGLSHNGTTFTIGIGDGHIVDKVTEEYFDVPFGPITGISPSTSNGVTYVFIDRTGSVSLQTSLPTAQNLRDKIYLGRVVTIAGSIVQVQDEPTIILQATNQIYDLGKALGIFNVSGNEITPNGANLNIDKSEGVLFSLGANFVTNSKNPHQVTIAASTQSTFAYITQLAGSTGANTITIDPANYDVAGTITAIPGSNNRASIQRVYLFPSGNIRIHYGQAYYNNIAEALQAINTEQFIINPNIPGNGVLVGIIVLVKNATSLNDAAQAQFLLASRFGQSSIGAAGRSVTSLQQAYNNSITPEIIVDSNNGAITIRDASTPIAAPLFEVQSNDGSSVYFEIDSTGITEGGGNAIFNANKLQSVDVASTSPSDGQVLTYSNANLRWEPVTPSGGGGSGDVVGPASSTLNAVPLFADTTGKLLKNSSVTVNTTNNQIYAPNPTYTNSMAIGTGLTVNGALTHMFGNSCAIGQWSVVMGYNIQGGSNQRCVGIGYGITLSGTSAIGIGYGLGSVAQGSVCIGAGSSSAGTNSVNIGPSTSSTAGFGNISIGAQATSGNATGYSMALGYQASCTAIQSFSFGYQTTCSGSYAFSIGAAASCLANYGLALGSGASVANAAHLYSMALGYGAVTTASLQCLIGGALAGIGGVKDVYIGTGVTNTTTYNTTINGTGRSGTNLAGVNMSIYPSRGTGNQVGGALRIGTSLAGASGTTLNSPTDLFEVGQFGTVTNPSYNNAGDFTILGILGYTMSFWDASTGSIYHYMDDIQHQDTYGQKMLVLQYNYRVYQAAASSAPADGDIFNNGICFYLDESGNNLKCKVKYSSGTVKTATIALA